MSNLVEVVGKYYIVNRGKSWALLCPHKGLIMVSKSYYKIRKWVLTYG